MSAQTRSPAVAVCRCQPINGVAKKFDDEISDRSIPFFITEQGQTTIDKLFNSYIGKTVCLSAPDLLPYYAMPYPDALQGNPKCIFFTDFDGTITLQDSRSAVMGTVAAGSSTNRGL